MNVLEKMYKKINSKEGSISLTVILVGGALFIAGLFFAVEMPIHLIYSNQMVDTVNNAAASAVTNLDEDLLRQGIIKVNEEEARESAYRIFRNVYSLEDNSLEPIDPIVYNRPTGNGSETVQEVKPNLLAGAPDVQVLFVDKPRFAGDEWVQTVTLPNEEEIQIRETSVIVFATLKYKPQIRSKSVRSSSDNGLELTRYAVSEVKFQENEPWLVDPVSP